MKGIVLSGGSGTRLRPLTGVPDPQNPEKTKKQLNNKHLLPIFNKQMIMYPILKLYEAEISEIMVITGGEKPGDFLELLGSGRDLWIDGKKISVELTFRYQDIAGGIAQALGLCESFVNNDKCVVILGDNIIEDDILPFVKEFQNCSGAKILLKPVQDPHHFGVADLENGKIVKITEKPLKNSTQSNLAVVGCYMYDSYVWEIISKIKPSNRGELEITDVNNAYLRRGCLSFNILEGFWLDSGSSYQHLLQAAMWAAKKEGIDLNKLGCDNN